MAKPLVFVVAGLGFGDEGKGSIVDFLAGQYNAHTVIRYNGGAQAAHNVIDSDGKHHTFAQFGSGTFVGARTHLSEYMLVNPIALESEEKHLRSLGIEDAYERLTIDVQALVTTPYHVAANRIEELLRGANRHGTCGMGIGETMSLGMNLRFGLLGNKSFTKTRLTGIANFYRGKYSWLIEDSYTSARKALKTELDVIFDPNLVDQLVETYQAISKKVQGVELDYFSTLLSENKTLIFEGAQGILLDEKYGMDPHTTWSNTTFGNANVLLSGSSRDINYIGVTRAYMTRHGEGPFPTEDSTLNLKEDHNPDTGWQGKMRLGHLDLPALRYALDTLLYRRQRRMTIALTHLDRIKWPLKVAMALKDNPPTSSVLEEAKLLNFYAGRQYEDVPDLTSLLNIFSHEENKLARISITSTGPTRNDKHEDSKDEFTN